MGKLLPFTISRVANVWGLQRKGLGFKHIQKVSIGSIYIYIYIYIYICVCVCQQFKKKIFRTINFLGWGAFYLEWRKLQEFKEAVYLPLTKPELYEDIGIKPLNGVILYGEPGTGNTLLAKAVANSTSATFLRVVGSELIQKYLGDGPKLVRELFRVANDLSPSIVFIDEIDAVGTKRYDAHSGGDREIQRTMLELLNQLDGFDSRGDVKVILATNKIESLDPALL
ncbi:putative proteasome endopeptidase complex [Helianthus annuus]|nr:putative proteasome endopeptidase complex [Helianthus annuus]